MSGHGLDQATRRGALTGAAALAGAAAFGTAAQAASPAGPSVAEIETLVRRAMQAFDVPGCAVAVVTERQTVLAQGYGVRELGAPQRVDAATVFPIASCTKAFTGAALALLVEEKKIGWEDPVIDHLPAFRMWDAYVTREMTVRDLLVHRSGLGLGAGDLLVWPATDFTRPEIVQRLRHIKPATSFRSRYAYDNVLYVVAGELIAAVSGLSWEDFVENRILRPLGMTDSAAGGARVRGDNRSTGHARLGGAVRGLGAMQALAPSTPRPNAAPAGGINASARDIAKWLTAQVRLGALPGGGRLFSEKTAVDLWRGRTLMRATAQAPETADDPAFLAYGSGWQIQDYRGRTYVWHSGSNQGHNAVTCLIPEKRVGFAVFVNCEEGMFLRTMMNTLLDRFLGLEPIDWLASSRQMAEAMNAAMAAAGAETEARPADAKGPSLPLSAYAGSYADAWYGEVKITEGPDGLSIDFTRSPTLKGRLEHWARDTFRTRFDPSVEDAFVTFALTPEGAIDQVKLKAVSPMADFSYDYHDLLLKPAS